MILSINVVHVHVLKRSTGCALPLATWLLPSVCSYCLNYPYGLATVATTFSTKEHAEYKKSLIFMILVNKFHKFTYRAQLMTSLLVQQEERDSINVCIKCLCKAVTVYSYKVKH